VSLSRFLTELEEGPAEAQGSLPSRETASCEQAWLYETSAASRNAVYCSRRAGKTYSGRRRAIRVLCSGPERMVHVVSLIRRNAKKHWWDPIRKMLTKLGWQFSVSQQHMILTLSNGSTLQCLGVDDSVDVDRIQGDFSHLIIGDEAHLPRDDVQKAFFDKAVPMLIDYGGAFDWLGLPPEVEPTSFSRALDNLEWAHFHWDLLDHDYPEPRDLKLARIEDDLKQRGMTWEHPEAKRTYRGERVRDPSSMAYEYLEGRNDYDPSTVDFDAPGWNHSVGLDFGYQDRDAVVALAWRMDDPLKRAYVRFAWQRNHLSTDSLADVVLLVGLVYHPVAWTFDHGGHGAVKVGETLAERLRVEMGVKPPDVLVSLGMVNDDLRTARLLLPTVDTETPRVLAAAKQRFAGRPSELARVESLLTGAGASVGAELAKVPKLVNPRTMKLSINPKGPNHSDVSEALRYAHHGAQNWRAQARKPEPTPEEARLLRRQAKRRMQGSTLNRW
jgi:hypothetical protein